MDATSFVRSLCIGLKVRREQDQAEHHGAQKNILAIQ
jgi:hypothetical protein